jgi:Ring finger domain
MKLNYLFPRNGRRQEKTEHLDSSETGEASSVLLSNYIALLQRNRDNENHEFALQQQGRSARRSGHESDVEHILRQSNEELQEILSRLQQGRESTAGRGNAVPPPACDEAVSLLPNARVQKTHRQKFEHDTTQCGICCDRLIDGVALIRLPCGHIFHNNCAASWLSRSCTCPECRYEVPTNDLKYEIDRKKKMKSRKVVTCSCHPSGMHECFFKDPAKSLFEQCFEKETVCFEIEQQ